MEAFQSDMSDVEQQEAFLAGANTKRWLPHPRLVGLVSAAALLAAATFAAKTLVTQNPAAVVVTGGQNSGTGAMDLETIQAYASASVGRMLTHTEVEKVMHFITEGRSHQIAKRHMKGLPLRWLKEEEDDEDEEEDEDEEDEDGDEEIPEWVSKECKKGMDKLEEDILEEMMPKIVMAGIEAGIACADDEESEACKSANAAVDDLDDDMINACKKIKSGTVCTMLQVMPDAGTNTTEDICVPKACLKHLSAERADMTKDLKEEKGCSKCYAELTCQKEK